MDNVTQFPDKPLTPETFKQVLGDIVDLANMIKRPGEPLDLAFYVVFKTALLKQGGEDRLSEFEGCADAALRVIRKGLSEK